MSIGSGHFEWRRLVALTLVLFGAGLALLSLAPRASAWEPPPEELLNFCPAPEAGEPAGGAGKCNNPRGLAGDPENGLVYVSELANNRVSEFNALGEFVRAWGWGVADGSPEFQICTSACRRGIDTVGAGALDEPNGIAIDASGDLYVTDRGNRRVQKFGPKGEFILMFGGEVNKTKVDEGTAAEAEENVCPVDPLDECQAGTNGTGQGQFDWAAPSPRSNIDVDSAGLVNVGDGNRIQRFEAGGAYHSEIALPGKGRIEHVAIDGADNIYFISQINTNVIQKLPGGSGPAEEIAVAGNPTALATDVDDNLYWFNGSSNLICTLAAGEEVCWGNGDFTASTAIAANFCAGSEAPGNVYVANSTPTVNLVRAYGSNPIGCIKARTGEATEVEETTVTLNGTVNPKGEAVTECFFEYGLDDGYGSEAPCAEPSAGEIGAGSAPVPVRAEVAGLDPGAVHHFRLVAVVGGETELGADASFKTKGPPVISGEHTISATQTEMTVGALVNPEGLQAGCRVDYGTSEGAYTQSTAAQPVGSDRTEHELSAVIVDLAPGTTYHWRLACENTSDETLGADREGITYEPFAIDGDCPNQALRAGPSAPLPDCRAYEMVSPVDKNGGDIVAPLGSGARGANNPDPGPFRQAARDGDRLTYTALPVFAGHAAGFATNQYIAERRARGAQGEGWSNRGIRPPFPGRPALPNEFGRERDFMLFTADLCTTWLKDDQTPPLHPEGQPGYRNLYERDNCAPPQAYGPPAFDAYEPLTPFPPPLPAGTPEQYVDSGSVQGISADGSHALFVAHTQLDADANPGFNAQLYDRFGGESHVVSVLPGGAPSSAATALGSGWFRNLEHALAADGSRAYWTNEVGPNGGGAIYLREHPAQDIVAGEECDPGKACTIKVSPGSSAFFWAATPSGSRALFSEGTDLFEFDLAEAKAEGGEPLRLVAKDVKGVAGVSDDLSRVYFVSHAALAGSGPNSEEDEPVAGEPNLYLAEGEAFEFVAALVDGDVGQKEPDIAGVGSFLAYDLASRVTAYRATRVTPDGSRIAFQSRAPLTGFDTTDAEGRPATEVFTYEAGGELRCVSCNPSRARPATRELGRPYISNRVGSNETQVRAAAWIPTWENPTHDSNVLSEDGGRIFFNSNDALVPRDANGTQDVYEWELAGTGGCSESDPSYFEANGGCLYLISSGQSRFESEFWEASPDGDDVFFTTDSSLLPQDPGLIDLYDARVGGGFPQPVEPAECEGEACGNPPPPPEFGAPASGAYRGPGNEPAALAPCGRAAKHAKRLSRRAKRARRAARKASNPAPRRRLQSKARRAAKSARKQSGAAKRCRRANRGRAAR